MPTSLTVDTARRHDGNVVLVAAGEVDLSNIDVFKQALAQATAEAAGSGAGLTVDLGAVEYMDSAAINALFARAESIGRIIAHPLVMSVFSISGLAELVPVEPAPLSAEP
jgi:anti-anti-sigma factor